MAKLIESKKKIERIVAVVVTYNRLELLKQCLESLCQQTRKLDAIIVVNNSSTDGTSEWLKKQKNLFVITQENLGGAGGFYTGMKVAYNKGYDWILVTDDDVIFDKKSINEMLKYRNISKFIHLSKYDYSGQKIFWDFKFNLNNLKGVAVKNNPNEPFFITNVACFEGALIHRSIIANNHFPDPRFFIIGDDTIYGYLASKNSKIICIRKYLIKKLIHTQIESPNSLYFRIRNISLIYRCLKEKGIHISRIYLFFNISWSVIRALTKIIFVLRFSRQHLKKLILGAYDGIIGNYGVPKWLSNNK